MSGSLTVRIIALLLLLMAGVEVYACDVSDACVLDVPGSDGGCDRPAGDNCLCCCHHAIPAAAFRLEPCDSTFEEPPAGRVPQVLSEARPIDLPPQL